MKQIIGGKTYNTSTAYSIGTRITIHKTKSTGERVEWYETLYQRKKDDEYFIHKKVFQIDSSDRMYYTWECINPISDSDMERWMMRKYKTVYEYE